MLGWAERERLLHRTSQNSPSTKFVHNCVRIHNFKTQKRAPVMENRGPVSVSRLRVALGYARYVRPCENVRSSHASRSARHSSLVLSTSTRDPLPSGYALTFA
jgi:hypothetical protein